VNFNERCGKFQQTRCGIFVKKEKNKKKVNFLKHMLFKAFQYFKKIGTQFALLICVKQKTTKEEFI